MTDPAPYLNGDLCSDCGVNVLAIADGEMLICPRCYALLWHPNWAQDEAARAFARTAELRAQRLAAKAERERIRWERRAAYLAGQDIMREN